MPSPLDAISMMRAVARGSAVDSRRSLAGEIVTTFRLGRRQAPKDSPLTLQDVMARSDYRDLMTPKIAEGDLAPDFELPRANRDGVVHLESLVGERPVALIFGSYT